MSEEAAIRSTMARYNLAGDGGDYASLARCFAADGELVLGPDLRFTGPAAIESELARRARLRGHGAGSGTFQRHFLGASLLAIDGSRTTATTYFQVITELGLDHVGQYDDVFAAIDGAWLLARRTPSLVWIHAQSRFRVLDLSVGSSQ